MPSRRAFVIGAAAASADVPRLVRAQTSSEQTSGEKAASPTILRLQRRSIQVNGKSASVFGIRQPDGSFGLTTEKHKRFRVRVENTLDEPS